MSNRRLTILQILALMVASACPVWAQADARPDRATEMTTLQWKAADQAQPPKILEDEETTSALSPAPLAPIDSANYAYATTVTGSLVDMSTGTTTLIAADQDDVASPVTLIGFEFFVLGTRQDRFSVNSNGLIRFGATQVSTTAYDPLAQAGQVLITAYGADQRTHAGNGKVHYKVTGTAPNRVLNIEWLNMQADFNAGGTAGLTYQVHLSETTGNIEFAYGAMAMSALGAADPNSVSPQLGLSSNNTVGTVGSITAAQSGTPAPTYSGAAAVPVNNTYVAGPIGVLTSAADGSRRTFALTTAPVDPPVGPLTFTAVSAASLTVNWTDAASEAGYAIYASTDGVNFSFLGTAAMNATSFAASALTPATSYTWRVYSFNEGNTAFVSGTQATAAATPNASLGSGLWSNPLTWSTGSIPGNGDAVTITAGTTVTIDTAAVAYSVSVNGTLQFEQTTARSLSVGSNVVVQGGGILQSNPAGAQTGHVLSIPGNLTNNGTLDFSTNADTAGANITFTSTANATFGGTGATTDVRTITVNKGTSNAAVLELNPTNFSVRGVTTDTVVGGWLVMTNGTIKISGTFSGSSRVFATAGYTIPATFGFWLNNPNYTVAAQAANAVNNGLLRLSAGTFSTGTLASHSVRAGTGAVFTIEGGTFNAAGQFSPQNAVTYNQSGGTMNVGLVGNSQSNFGTFELFSASSTFNMTGGTIIINQASTGATPIDYQNLAVANNASGTLRTGTGATVTNFNFRVRGSIPNLIIDNTTNNKTATATAQVILFGSTTINTGATFVINGQVCLVRGSPFTNNGTLTGTAASTRFYFLGGGGPTTYTGNGVVTAPLTAFEVDNIAGVTLDPAVNFIVTSRFNNFSGGLTGSGKLTIGNGGATTAVVQLGVTGVTQTVSGFDVPPAFNPGTGGVILLYAPELTGRTTGNEMPASRTLSTLAITNTNNITLAGGDVTVNGAAVGALALGAPRVITGANTLYFNSAAGTVTRSTGYVDGNFRKTFPAAASQTFEVGTANGYTPVTVNASAGAFPADVTVAAVQATAPNIFPPGKAITRYWNVAATGLTLDLTLSYLDPQDLPGTVTEANLVLYRQSGASYTNLGGSLDTTNNFITQTGLTTFGLFTLAEPGALFSGNADLSVTKTDGVTSVNAGGTLTYTIAASNAGPLAANGATVTDTVPAGLTCTWTCSSSGGGTCTAGGSGSIADTINLPVGAVSTYTMTCSVSLAGIGNSVANTASIAPPAEIADTNPANDSATDTDTVIHDANLSITNSDGVSTVDTGGSLTYAIIASNAGPVNAPGSIVADTFPSDLTCTWTCTGSGGGTCTASGAGNINDTVNLPSGGSVSYSAICSVATTSANPSIVNTATVTAPAGVNDANPVNNTATDTDSLVRLVNLSISKTDGVTSVTPGSAVTYQIVSSNAGPNVASVVIDDTFPSNLSGCTWTCAASGGTCAASGSGNIADNGSINSGGTLTYSATCTVIPSAIGTLANIATIASTDPTTRDTSTGNDSATDTDTLTPQSDVSVTLTDNRHFVQIGDSLSYVLTVSNSAGQSTAIASVSDILPATLGSGSWTCVPTAGASCAGGSGNTLSDSATLPPGSSAGYIYTATVVSEGGGTIANSANATVAGDTNTGNNVATDTPADTVVIFQDGFEGTPLTEILSFEPIAAISGQVHVNPAFLDGLRLQPQELVRGLASTGETLFVIEVARFNPDYGVRVITRDAAGLSQASAWQHVDLALVNLDLSWQSSAAGKDDGHVLLAGGETPLYVGELASTRKLSRLLYGANLERPWMNWTLNQP
jgi:uncharacterized repeat protein (TIGR01451 family)